MISSDEAEEILSLLRKTLSGSIGRNILDISFSNQQVLESDEHKLLSALRKSSLSDDNAIRDLYNKIVQSVDIDSSYFVLIANDKYDIFTYDANGDKNESPEVFSYVICAICPIKNAKPTLGYNLKESRFKNIVRDTIISAPEVGFMFPSFEARTANIYSATLYTRDVSIAHSDFIETLFKSDIPIPATEQTENFATLLNKTVTEECSLELIQSVQAQLIELKVDHKANKEDEPLTLSAKDMSALWRFGGVLEDSISSLGHTPKLSVQYSPSNRESFSHNKPGRSPCPSRRSRYRYVCLFDAADLFEDCVEVGSMCFSTGEGSRHVFPEHIPRSNKLICPSSMVSHPPSILFSHFLYNPHLLHE